MALVLPPPRDDHRPGQFFTWDEMQVTSTGLANIAPAQARCNLRCVCFYLLDPIRRALGPLKVNSGYRSKAVNVAVGGSKTSAHMKGLAADIKSYNGSYSPEDIVTEIVKQRMDFDQVILYNTFVHVGLAHGRMRNQFLKYEDGKYKPLDWTRLVGRQHW
jgi:hypothetical protein